MSRLGFIGTGHIAAPMVRYLAGRGHEVIVSTRGEATARQLTATHGVRVADNQDVLDDCDIVFLCVRPSVAKTVLADLTFRAQHQVISVMAGVSLAQLRDLCDPVQDITLTIPLGYLEHGGCPLPACPSGRVLSSLFEPDNPVLEVPEERAFNMHFAVCAFVPGLLDLMVTTSEWLAGQTNDADQAARYVTGLIAGFLAHLPDGGAGVLPQERDALATEGTLSLQMTTGLRDGRAHEALAATLTEIGTRLEGMR